MNISEKITSNHIAQAYAAKLQPPPSDQTRTSNTDAKGEPSHSDEVVLSEQALLLRKAKEALAASPDVREEKVAYLRAQVQAGKYQMPEEGLLAKLLEMLKG